MHQFIRISCDLTIIYHRENKDLTNDQRDEIIFLLEFSIYLINITKHWAAFITNKQKYKLLQICICESGTEYTMIQSTKTIYQQQSLITQK